MDIKELIKKCALILIMLLLVLFGWNKVGTRSLEPLKTEVIETQNIEETDISEVPLNNQTNISETLLNNQSNATEINTTEDVIEDETEKTHVVGLYKTANAAVFVPEKLKISVGDTVRWINRLDYHNKTAKISVYAHHGVFRSPILDYNESFEYTFTEKGTIIYTATPYTALIDIAEVIVE